MSPAKPTKKTKTTGAKGAKKTSARATAKAGVKSTSASKTSRSGAKSTARGKTAAKAGSRTSGRSSTASAAKTPARSAAKTGARAATTTKGRAAKTTSAATSSRAAGARSKSAAGTAKSAAKSKAKAATQTQKKTARPKAAPKRATARASAAATKGKAPARAPRARKTNEADALEATVSSGTASSTGTSRGAKGKGGGTGRAQPRTDTQLMNGTKDSPDLAAAAEARLDLARADSAAAEAPAAADTSPRPSVRTRRPAAELPPIPDSYSPPLRKLVEVAREVMGIEALRPGQAEALEHILAGKDTLAVMPTGSGKSLLYQLPSLILPGLTVVVSPLIALIKDQIDKMEARGVAVCRVDSTLTVKQRREMEALAQAPGGKLLLTTPERMADPEFREMLRTSAGNVGVSLFVVDEAHCVSQWGHDFRPSYLVTRKALEDVGRPPVLATTATAPPHVREDILHQLGMPDAEVVTTTFDRPNLHYEVIPLPGDDDKLKTLVTLLKKLPRPGIVYCATVKKVEDLHEKLARHGISVAKYHGRLTKKERDANQQAFMDSKELVMIATNAFGLGVDKRDIRYVLHYHVPGSLEAYAQEAGRGGRDGRPARCVLLFSPDDVAIQEYFLTGTYPTRSQVRAVYKALEAWSEHEEAQPTIANLAVGSRVGAQRTRTVLSLLKDEGWVTEGEGSTFYLADPPPDPGELNERARQYEARRIADRQRLDALLAYVGAAGCRSQVILSYLGEPEPPPCGRCDNCLRSKEAALAAAQEATRLERALTRQLDEEEPEIDRPRRVVRHRVVRIDRPEGEVAAVSPAAEEPRAGDPARQRPTSTQLAAEAEVTGSSPPRLAAYGDEADDDRTYDDAFAPSDEDDELGADAGQLLAPEADAEAQDDDEAEDEPENEEEGWEEFDEGEFDEEDDEYEYEEVIDKTAAALAEEGYQPEDSEITILARKRQPKQPKQQARPQAQEAEPKKRRRRRRRKKKSLMPPKSAFQSPVLQSQVSRPPPSSGRSSRSAGPLVEYVRGPMRINMTPVASATPNDSSASRKKQQQRRRRPGGPSGYGNGVPAPRPPQGSPPAASGGAASGPRPPHPAQAGGPSPHPTQQPGDPSEGGRKKKRRRRRRRGRGNGGTDTEGPVGFFSVNWPDRGGGSGQPSGGGSPEQHAGGNGEGGKRKRKRRRRRGRGGAGRSDNSGPSTPPPPEGSSES